MGKSTIFKGLRTQLDSKKIDHVTFSSDETRAEIIDDLKEKNPTWGS